MKIRKTQLESMQVYDFTPKRDQKPEIKLCPYCQYIELEDPDDYACETCKIELKQLN
jgi:uncharacterized paraquat-inducible protein A